MLNGRKEHLMQPVSTYCELSVQLILMLLSFKVVLNKNKAG